MDKSQEAMKMGNAEEAADVDLTGEPRPVNKLDFITSRKKASRETTRGQAVTVPGNAPAHFVRTF